MKKRSKVDAESFEQLLTELKDLQPNIEDVYYCPHIGNWSIKYTDGQCDEFDTVIDIIYDAVNNYHETFKERFID